MGGDGIEVPAALERSGATLAVVLGSGLGPFVESLRIEGEVPYAAVRGLPAPRVAGHAGRFLVAELGSVRLLIADGRVHLYEGWSAREVTAGVRLLHAAGARTLVLTNAAGSVNPSFAPPSWMMLRDHLNLTGTSPLLGTANFCDLSETYDVGLRRQFAAAAQQAGITLHEGIYAAVPGPQYETPAEVRMLRTLGADAVGMSTVLEAIQARALGLEVAAFSCLTNRAATLDGARLDHADVIEAGRSAAGDFARLLAAVAPRLAR